MSKDFEPKPGKLPMPPGLGGISEREWNDLSAKTKESIYNHIIAGQETNAAAEESLEKGECPQPVQGITVIPEPTSE